MQTISQIINRNSKLEELIAKAKELQQLNQIFCSALETSLSKHCHLSKIKGSELVVTVDSSAWATRLRYAIPEIIKNIRTQPEFKDIEKIKYTVK